MTPALNEKALEAADSEAGKYFHQAHNAGSYMTAVGNVIRAYLSALPKPPDEAQPEQAPGPVETSAPADVGEVICRRGLQMVGYMREAGANDDADLVSDLCATIAQLQIEKRNFLQFIRDVALAVGMPDPLDPTTDPASWNVGSLNAYVVSTIAQIREEIKTLLDREAATIARYDACLQAADERADKVETALRKLLPYCIPGERETSFATAVDEARAALPESALLPKKEVR